MGELTISTPDFSTPQAPSNKALNNTITKLIFIFFLIIFSLLLYFISSPIVSPKSTEEGGFIPTPTPTPISTVTLGLVGDLSLGRYITSTARNKQDFSWSFREISPWLLSNDFNLANLESPIITSCPEGKTGTFTFCGDEKFLPYLKSNKFVLNLANNHILNYGPDGLSQTHNFLSENNIIYFPEFTTKKINGISFGFLGYDFITYPVIAPTRLWREQARQSQIIADIEKYNPEVDWLIVSIHWGNEYLPKAETWRVNLARELVDAGADIIHGHHPHVWQDYEIYKDKPIFYSFGNFIFDQSWSYETSHSQIARLILSKTKIKDLELFPIEIKYNSQPALIFGAPASGAPTKASAQ